MLPVDKAWITDSNPFYHLIEIVRKPLLGETVAIESWYFVTLTAITFFLISSFIHYKNTGHRSLRKNILRAASGGKIAKDSSQHTIVKALNDINLHLQAGDKLGLVGHNGSGKSTLLRAIAGAYVPTTSLFAAS